MCEIPFIGLFFSFNHTNEHDHAVTMILYNACSCKITEFEMDPQSIQYEQFADSLYLTCFAMSCVLAVCVHTIINILMWYKKTAHRLDRKISHWKECLSDQTGPLHTCTSVWWPKQIFKVSKWQTLLTRDLSLTGSKLVLQKMYHIKTVDRESIHVILSSIYPTNNYK